MRDLRRVESVRDEGSVAERHRGLVVLRETVEASLEARRILGPRLLVRPVHEGRERRTRNGRVEHHPRRCLLGDLPILRQLERSWRTRESFRRRR